MRSIAMRPSCPTGSTPAAVLTRLAMAALLVAAFLLTALPVRAQHAQHVVAQTPAQAKVAEAAAAQRDLWVGHIFWVRNVAVDTLAGNRKAAAAAEPITDRFEAAASSLPKTIRRTVSGR